MTSDSLVRTVKKRSASVHQLHKAWSTVVCSCGFICQNGLTLQTIWKTHHVVCGEEHNLVKYIMAIFQKQYHHWGPLRMYRYIFSTVPKSKGTQRAHTYAEADWSLYHHITWDQIPPDYFMDLHKCHLFKHALFFTKISALHVSNPLSSPVVFALSC